jgi:uncharacterized protein (DUF1697 family)
VPVWIGLLRAVNVGGTGKLPMADLRSMCVEIGFRDVATYIASGNVVFRADADKATVTRALAERLERYAGRPIGVTLRTASQMRAVLAACPFRDAAPNCTVAIFLPEPPAGDALSGVRNRVDEEIALGVREIYVSYGAGMGTSKLAIPAARNGTARNMNTVAKLADMADWLEHKGSVGS